MLKVLAPVEMRILNEQELLMRNPIIAPDGYIPNSVVRKNFKLPQVVHVPKRQFQLKPVPKATAYHMPESYETQFDSFPSKRRRRTPQPASQSMSSFIEVQKSSTNLSEPSIPVATKAENKPKPITPTKPKNKLKNSSLAQQDVHNGAEEKRLKLKPIVPVMVSKLDMQPCTTPVKKLGSRQVVEMPKVHIGSVNEEPLLSIASEPTIELEMYRSKPDEVYALNMLAMKLRKPEDPQILNRTQKWVEGTIPGLFEEDGDNPLLQQRSRKAQSIMTEGKSGKESLYSSNSKGTANIHELIFSSNTSLSRPSSRCGFSPTIVRKSSGRNSRKGGRLTPCNPELYKYYDNLNAKRVKQAEQMRLEKKQDELNHAGQPSDSDDTTPLSPVGSKMQPLGDGRHRIEPVPEKLAVHSQNENGISDDEFVCTLTVSHSLTNQHAIKQNEWQISLPPPTAKESCTGVSQIKKKHDGYYNFDQIENKRQRLCTSPRRQKTDNFYVLDVTSKPLHKPYEITESIENFIKNQSLPKQAIVLFPSVKFE